MKSGYWRRGKSGAWSWTETQTKATWPESGYSITEAKSVMAKGLSEVNDYYSSITTDLTPRSFVLIELFSHPARQKGHNLPLSLIKKLNWVPIENFSTSIKPRSALEIPHYDIFMPRPTIKILVAIKRLQIEDYIKTLLGLNPESREAAELACLEKTRPYYPKRNLTGQPSSVTPLDQATKKGWLLANLYPIPGTKIYSLTGFKVFAKKLGFEGRVITQAGRKIQFPGHPEQRLMALKLKGPLANAIELSKYALIESISLLKELNVKTKSLSKTQDSLENVWEQSYI